MRFLVLCVCLLSFNVSAVMVTDLYSVNVAVDDQTDESRKLGIQRAFQQLLIKVSGYQNALINPALMSASQNAERYLQGFSYQQDSFDGQIYLQAWFSKALVVPLVKRAKMPIWGENRPLLINWLAIEPIDNMNVGRFDIARLIEHAQAVNNSLQDPENPQHFATAIDPANSSEPAIVETPVVRGKRMMVSEQTPELQKRFNQAFFERGLPVLWPMHDLEDQSSLPLNQLWWLATDSIKIASQRYQADAILAGKLNLDSAGRWQYEGVLFHNGEQQNIATEGDSPMLALTLATSEVSRFFANQFAIKSDPMNGRSGIRVSVSKVNNFTDYSQVLKYFKRITGVRLVEVAQVNQNNVQLFLSLEGSWDKVQRIISLDNKLSMLGDKEFEWTQ